MTGEADPGHGEGGPGAQVGGRSSARSSLPPSGGRLAGRWVQGPSQAARDREAGRRGLGLGRRLQANHSLGGGSSLDPAAPSQRQPRQASALRGGRDGVGGTSALRGAKPGPSLPPLLPPSLGLDLFLLQK